MGFISFGGGYIFVSGVPQAHAWLRPCPPLSRVVATGQRWITKLETEKQEGKDILDSLKQQT